MAELPCHVTLQPASAKPGPPMASIPLFKYDRYQRAASFFLDWLIRGHGHSHPSTQSVQLDSLSQVVQEIANDPSCLSDKLRQELPKALAACSCALKLCSADEFLLQTMENRDVATRLSRLLKVWHRTLEKVPHEKNGTLETEEGREEGEEEDEEEGFYPGEERFVLDVNTPKRVKTALKRLCAEAFADDLALDVVFFVLELEELVRGVHEIYSAVKAGGCCMIEATVAAKLAVDTATDLTTRLQQRRPEIRTMENLLDAVMKLTPAIYGLAANSASSIKAKFDKDGTYMFSPFELVRDFEIIWAALTSFAKILPPSTRAGFLLPPNERERYGEERTPQYVLPTTDMIDFLVQSFALMYNTVSEKKEVTARLEGAFMGLMTDYFATRQVTIPLVFAWTCWVKSVAALQGDGGLGRNVSATMNHADELMQRMATLVDRPTVLNVIKPESSRGDLLPNRSRLVQRTNPFSAGFVGLDFQLGYLRAGHQSLLRAPIFRAFGHLYNALVGQEFLEPIPLIEDVLEIYEKWVFTPSRAAVVRGAYDRTYLHHSGYAATSSNRVVSPGQDWGEKEEGLGLRNASQIWRFLVENDSSSFRDASLRTMLYKAGKACSAEMFGTRVLSRDMLALLYDIADVFSELCDVLDQRQACNDYIRNAECSGDIEERKIDALENAVMFPLLPLLDALQSDGSLDLDILPAAISSRSEDILSAEKVRAMARKAAEVIGAKFAVPVPEIERRYFTFPPRPDFVSQKFGTESFKIKTKLETREGVFSDLMLLLERSQGPLSERDLAYLKDKIKEDPQLLSLMSPRTRANRDDLCTLLHQAAAGPAHDADLVEWMVNMGALFNQPTTHCREEPPRKDLVCPRDCLPNTMAVHSAAMKGYDDIVMILLAADNLIDLNTPTYHTKETIAHLAVKAGNRLLYRRLCSIGADFSQLDSKGKHVWELTTDPAWSRMIAAEDDKRKPIQRAATRARPSRRNNRKGFEVKVQPSLYFQPDEESSHEGGSSTKPAASPSTKKAKRKGRRASAGKRALLPLILHQKKIQTCAAKWSRYLSQRRLLVCETPIFLQPINLPTSSTPVK